MIRLPKAALVVALFIVATMANAAEPLVGHWKFNAALPDAPSPLWLLNLQSADGVWTGKVIGSAEGVSAAQLSDLTVTADAVSFNLKIGSSTLHFESKAPKEGATKVLGSLDAGGQLVTASLEKTELKSLDKYDVSREILSKPGDTPELFAAALTLIRQAGQHESKPEEVRAWADRAFKAAEAYGPRWQRDIGVRLAEALARDKAFAPIALEYARRTERLLDAKDSASVQLRVLSVLASALRVADKADEAKAIEIRVEKLEIRSYQEYSAKMPPFKVPEFSGRKSEGGRRVLLELFTGAQCPPCVAADVAFDAALKRYKPTEVILLQYHLHIPGPDPLTNADTEARQRFYGDAIEGTPTMLFNGKAGAEGGGPLAAAGSKFKEYVELIDPSLEKPAKVKLKVTATRKADTIEIAAEASDLESTGKDVHLRLALVEEWVRYRGGNNLQYHHCVVRALPGGAAGVVLKEGGGKQNVSVDVAELRKKLTSYLDEHAKDAPFPNPERPLGLKNLHVVAFVQDDDTKEILQSAQVPAGAEEK
jgi:hypothetical protein